MWSRICTTWPEKPHIGNCGVPFMNSTTSFDLTSLSMNWSMLMICLVCVRRLCRVILPSDVGCRTGPRQTGLADRLPLRNASLQCQGVQFPAHFGPERLVNDLVLLYARFATKRLRDHGRGIVIAVA